MANDERMGDTPRTGWQPELDELHLRERLAHEMGGADKVLLEDQEVPPDQIPVHRAPAGPGHSVDPRGDFGEYSVCLNPQPTKTRPPINMNVRPCQTDLRLFEEMR